MTGAACSTQASPHCRRPQSEACRQAGGPECLQGWAALAVRHGVVSLDYFEHGRGIQSILRLLTHIRPATAPSAGTGSAAFAAAGLVAGRTAGAQPPGGRPRLRKMLSIVAEDPEEGLETAVAAAAEAAAQLPSVAEGAHAGPPLPESSSSSDSGDGMQTAGHLLAAAAAVGLIPRPGSGSHLSNADGGSIMLVHLDAVPLSFRFGALCCKLAAFAVPRGLPLPPWLLTSAIHATLPPPLHNTPQQAAKRTLSTCTGCRATLWAAACSAPPSACTKYSSC